MYFIRRILLLILIPLFLQAKLPELTPEITKEKITEIMSIHAEHKKMTPELMKRVLTNFLEEIDPSKTYFLHSDIEEWLNPKKEQVEQLLHQFNEGNYQVFEKIHQKVVNGVKLKQKLEKQIDRLSLPEKVDPKEFKDLKWAKDSSELLERLVKIRALQIEVSEKINKELQDKALERIKKHQKKYEELLLTKDLNEKNKFILSKVLKALASALDAHTAYFTPDEAKQFIISVQQRLFGIGAQLLDNINGFSVIKIIEGGPADRNGKLKVKDRIIAVDNEPVVGMDIIDAVELIRGEKDTPVLLTVIREDENGNEETLNIEIMRGEVVLKETRYKSSYEPFGDGAIGYIKLHSFYQDPEFSSTLDLQREIEKLKSEHQLKGLIFDLRSNTGGILSQAVGVAGLFINRGIVVTIKDENGELQHLRDMDGKTTWDGPLIILTNRASASASEIVAKTLQDYGRAIIVGDDHTFGKGTFQTFTLNGDQNHVNPEGEYKVTRGKYYTVSGKTPQLVGVQADVVVPGPLSEIELGEKFAKYPLGNDSIEPNFDDDLSDIPYFQRQRIAPLYRYNLQKPTDKYTKYLDILRKNSARRIAEDKNYQTFLKEIKKKELSDEEPDAFGQNDLQLSESINIMKDLILLLQ